MDTASIDASIDAFEKDAPTLRQAIAGLSDRQLNATPVPGTWSIQQIVIHIMDTELVLVDRAKRIVAHDNPSLLAFNENQYVAQLHYDLWSVHDAAAIVELHRKNFARVLRALPESAFARTGVHSERGTMTLADILAYLNRHLEHHLKFIQQKRQMLEQSK